MLTKQGWEWIFILEGLFTVLVAIVSYWVIQDFPDTARFLTPEERTEPFKFVNPGQLLNIRLP